LVFICWCAAFNAGFPAINDAISISSAATDILQRRYPPCEASRKIASGSGAFVSLDGQPIAALLKVPTLVDDAIGRHLDDFYEFSSCEFTRQA
jgi:hypothetical protein